MRHHIEAENFGVTVSQSLTDGMTVTLPNNVVTRTVIAVLPTTPSEQIVPRAATSNETTDRDSGDGSFHHAPVKTGRVPELRNVLR